MLKRKIPKREDGCRGIHIREEEKEKEKESRRRNICKKAKEGEDESRENCRK